MFSQQTNKMSSLETPPLKLLLEEESFYSQLQIEVLNDKKNDSYAYVKGKYGFTANQQLENFLFRTFLGFKMDTKEGSCVPIPLVPDIISAAFISRCNEQTIDLNSIYTYKALRILEDFLN